MNEKLSAFQGVLQNPLGLAAVFLVTVVIGLIFPVLMRRLGINRRSDVILRGALMSGVLAFASGIINLFAVFILIYMLGLIDTVIVASIVTSTGFAVTFAFEFFLCSKLYFDRKHSIVFGLVDGLLMSISLLFIFL